MAHITTLLISIYTVSLIALSLGGGESERRPRWLTKPPPEDLTQGEKEKHHHLEYMLSLLDSNDDGKLSMEEIADKLEFLSMGKEAPSLGYEELKYLLQGEPPLMEDSVFQDMWFLMTHRHKGVEDFTEIFFKYMDSNGDGLVDRSELETFLINGRRTERSPIRNTEYTKLFEALDKDNSGGINPVELRTPVEMLLKSQPKEEMAVVAFVKTIQDYSKLPASLLDANKLATCLDSDHDGTISLAEGGKDLTIILDKNYNGVVDGHEMLEIPKELKKCAEGAEATKRNKEEL